MGEVEREMRVRDERTERQCKSERKWPEDKG